MTGNESSAPRILGTLRSESGQGAVRVEDIVDAPAAEVWASLTEPARLAEWIGEVTGDLRAGGQFRGSFVTGWEGAARIDDCRTAQHLVLTMDVGEPGENVIEATLTADGDKTGVVLEQRGLPLDYLAAFGAGLQVHAEDLAANVGGRKRCDTKARWDELIPSYRDQAAKLG